MSANAPGARGATPPSESRYERVKRILNEAQGACDASYQGYHRFWELPLAEFLEFTLYGVRMIAPAPSSGAGNAGSASPGSGSAGSASASSTPCCGCPPDDGDDSSDDGGDSPSSDRSATSGLIKGLKGEAPFDGSQFPRLTWGGQPVAAADIAFIAQWIDAGCPADDTPREPASVKESTRHALAHGHEAHPVSPKTLNQHRADTGGLKARKNVACLTPDELRRLRCAIRRMHCYDAHYQDERSYDYWARIHANNCQHGWEEFLTWHRIYLYYFEQRLQDIDPTVTLPYWDWTMYDQDWPALTVDTGVIPEAYRCFVDDGVLAGLQGKIPAATLAQLTAIKGQTFNSGPRLFKGAGIPYPQDKTVDDAIVAALQAANPLWHVFRWPGGDSSIIFENYPQPQDITNILAIDAFFPFGSGPNDDHFFGALENVHNLMHNFSGGINPNYNASANPPDPSQPQTGSMVSAGTTAFDPIFWGHHSNVDRLWDQWQQLHPGGPDDPTAALPPFALNVADSYSVKKLGYEYSLGGTVYETDPATPITRFKSAKTAVHPVALAQHSHAEVRLHRVRHSVNGAGYLRVFLNEPDATATTPTRGNDHFVGQFALSLTGCIGGPGHCAPPPAGPQRKFDLRERHRKTPGNLRLDATETIKKLRAKGDTEFHIHVVALGLDGKPHSDLLCLEAVSLEFFD